MIVASTLLDHLAEHRPETTYREFRELMAMFQTFSAMPQLANEEEPVALDSLASLKQRAQSFFEIARKNGLLREEQKS
jgi:hypothetical protein